MDAEGPDVHCDGATEQCEAAYHQLEDEIEVYLFVHKKEFDNVDETVQSTESPCCILARARCTERNTRNDRPNPKFCCSTRNGERITKNTEMKSRKEVQHSVTEDKTVLAYH